MRNGEIDTFEWQEGSSAMTVQDSEKRHALQFYIRRKRRLRLEDRAYIWQTGKRRQQRARVQEGC